MTDVLLTRIVETSRFHPALRDSHFQWEAWDARDNFFLLRYRSGVGTVDALKDDDSWGRDQDDYTRIAQFDTGRSDESDIPLGDFCRHAGIPLTPSVAVVGLLSGSPSTNSPTT